MSAGRAEGSDQREEKVTPADSEGCLVKKEVASARAGDCVGMESGQSVSGRDGVKDVEGEPVIIDAESELAMKDASIPSISIMDIHA